MIYIQLQKDVVSYDICDGKVVINGNMMTIKIISDS